MNKSSNTPLPYDSHQTFRVTHPFHPLYEQTLDFFLRRQNWGEDRVYYTDDNGGIDSLLVSWTSVADPDLFVEVAQGRSFFRFDDMVQ